MTQASGGGAGASTRRGAALALGGAVVAVVALAAAVWVLLLDGDDPTAEDVVSRTGPSSDHSDDLSGSDPATDRDEELGDPERGRPAVVAIIEQSRGMGPVALGEEIVDLASDVMVGASLSPDGRRVVALEYSMTTGESRTVVTDLETGRVEVVAGDHFPAFAPDGTLATVEWPDWRDHERDRTVPGSGQVVVLDTGFEEVRRIPFEPLEGPILLAWDTTGDRLVAWSSTYRSTELWLVDVAAGSAAAVALDALPDDSVLILGDAHEPGSFPVVVASGLESPTAAPGSNEFGFLRVIDGTARFEPVATLDEAHDPRYPGERFGPAVFVVPIGRSRVVAGGGSLRFEAAEVPGFVVGDEWNTYSIDADGNLVWLYGGSAWFDVAPAGIGPWLGRDIPLPEWVDLDDG